jgi:hypothetical protein
MAVSIKVREDTKRRLEHLRANLASRFGREMTLQDLLDALTAVGERDPGNVVSFTTKVKLPLSAAAQKRILSRAWDMGPTSEDDMDRVLYSDEALHGRSRPPARGRR